jgi:hypothetical protein
VILGRWVAALVIVVAPLVAFEESSTRSETVGAHGSPVGGVATVLVMPSTDSEPGGVPEVDSDAGAAPGLVFAGVLVALAGLATVVIVQARRR